MTWIYWLGWITFGSAFRSVFGMRVKNREKLITDGPVLIASNHQSFLDPPLIGNLYQEGISYLARKSLFRGFGAWLYPRWKAIPVDQDKPEMASLKTVIKLLKEGEKVLIFPEGARTDDGTLQEAAPGIGLIAAKSGAVIQPVRIAGAREALPRGSARIRFSRITVTIGDPIRLSAEELKAAKSKDDYVRITQRIMAAIKQLDGQA
ncbi:MAG: lysophospholipid acyltransferase family protein [Verrucomicrobiota bacterium]